jgi:hypothetical protein
MSDQFSLPDIVAAIGRKPTTEKVKIVFSKWSLIGQKETFGSSNLAAEAVFTRTPKYSQGVQ